MIQIDKTLVSLDIIEEHFICDIKKCKGICCVDGDSGAPLTAEEVTILTNEIDKILPYLPEDGQKAIKKGGVSYIDQEGESVTMLINKEECAFVVDEDGAFQCGIEKAYEAGAIDFKKPISCHLYPIRVTKYHNYEAINYDKWGICKHACLKGKKENVTVKEFLKAPLIRNYGEEWYNKLDEISKEIKEKGIK